MLSKGTIYNFGSGIKDFGERMAHVSLLGIPLLRWCCGPVIRLGFAIKDYAHGSPMENEASEKSSEGK